MNKIVKFVWWLLVINPAKCINAFLRSNWLKDFIHNGLVHPVMVFLPATWGEALHERNARWAFPESLDDTDSPEYYELKTYIPNFYSPDKDLTKWETHDGFFTYRVDAECTEGGFLGYVNTLEEADTLIAHSASGAIQSVVVTTCWLTEEEFKKRNNRIFPTKKSSEQSQTLQ